MAQLFRELFAQVRVQRTMTFTTKSILIGLATWALLIPSAALARNVDLSTVPPRRTVQLTIYNSEDITLVKETRTVTFKKGNNPLQFSWANTLIDPSSVQMRFLTSPDKLDTVDTTFPHDKPQMLYWNVKSEFDGEATIEIQYFTSGITWSADYQLVADKDEKEVKFEGFVRVSNGSGEDYEGAQVRLVVGTINLVEKIAQLARIPMEQVKNLEANQRDDYKRKAAKDAIAEGEVWLDMPANGPQREKQIVKEGLSEYFIYTVEGTETVLNGWSKRMRSLKEVAVPVKIQYRYRPVEYGDQLVRMYLMTNDKPSQLGTTPLPDGVVRTFRDNGRDGLSYLAQQTIKYIPIGDKIELNLGRDPNVIFELIKLKVFRDEIWMHVNGVDVFERVADGAVKIDVNSSVAGWNDHEIYTQRIRNYTAKPIDLEARRAWPGHILFRSLLGPTLFDFQTVQMTTNVEAGATKDMLFEIVRLNGRNSKQNNVTLQEAEVKP